MLYNQTLLPKRMGGPWPDTPPGSATAQTYSLCHCDQNVFG